MSFTVVIVERATPGLRGRLTRWMLEVQAGVFVGKLSARVREAVWHEVRSKLGSVGASLLVYGALNEQGFVVETAGDPSRECVDYDGLMLLRRPLAYEAGTAFPGKREKPKRGARKQP